MLTATAVAPSAARPPGRAPGGRGSRRPRTCRSGSPARPALAAGCRGRVWGAASGTNTRAWRRTGLRRRRQTKLAVSVRSCRARAGRGRSPTCLTGRPATAGRRPARHRAAALRRRRRPPTTALVPAKPAGSMLAKRRRRSCRVRCDHRWSVPASCSVPIVPLAGGSIAPTASTPASSASTMPVVADWASACTTPSPTP